MHAPPPPPSAHPSCTQACPVWILESEAGGSFYGFPADQHGFKLGRYHHLRQATSADGVHRGVDEQDEAALRECVRQFFPGAREGQGGVSPTRACMHARMHGAGETPRTSHPLCAPPAPPSTHPHARAAQPRTGAWRAPASASSPTPPTSTSSWTATRATRAAWCCAPAAAGTATSSPQPSARCWQIWRWRAARAATSPCTALIPRARAWPKRSSASAARPCSTSTSSRCKRMRSVPQRAGEESAGPPPPSATRQLGAAPSWELVQGCLVEAGGRVWGPHSAQGLAALPPRRAPRQRRMRGRRPRVISLDRSSSRPFLPSLHRHSTGTRSRTICARSAAAPHTQAST